MEPLRNFQISIITISHKSTAHIGAFVSSFLEAHKEAHFTDDIELIVIENSGDRTIEASLAPLQAAGFQTKLIYSENKGFGTACNLGAESATGKCLAFVNPDLTFATSLEDLIRVAGDRAWGTVRQRNGQGRNYCLDLLPEHKGLLFELFRGFRLVNLMPGLFRSKCYVIGSFFWVSKELFHAVGMFNVRFFLYYEEVELSRRLSRISVPVVLKGIAVDHEGMGSHSGSFSAKDHQWDGFVEYCKITQQIQLYYRVHRTLRLLAIVSPSAAYSLKVMEAREGLLSGPSEPCR